MGIFMDGRQDPKEPLDLPLNKAGESDGFGGGGAEAVFDGVGWAVAS